MEMAKIMKSPDPEIFFVYTWYDEIALGTSLMNSSIKRFALIKGQSL